MMNINNIPEPFREFLGTNQRASEKADQKEQGVSAASVKMDTDPELGSEKNRGDMQDLLFLAAILLLCDE